MAQHRTHTRGHGLLESFLSRRRAIMAERLIARSLQAGCILDIGCGTWPYFLTRSTFSRRIGVDQIIDSQNNDETDRSSGLRLYHFNANRDPSLPLRDAECDVVTMLAVFEHIRQDRLIPLLDEVHRVLKVNGLFIMTTPAGWTGPILRCLTRLGLVSSEEIDEHQEEYSDQRILEILGGTRFASCPRELGHFEMGLNTYVRIRKTTGESD